MLQASCSTPTWFKDARFEKVKSPTEVVIGTIRLVKDFTTPKLGLHPLANNIRYMGQDLMNPPTVEGWHTGKEWIDSGTLVERINFAADQVGNTGLPGVQDIVNRLGSENVSQLLKSWSTAASKCWAATSWPTRPASQLVEHASEGRSSVSPWHQAEFSNRVGRDSPAHRCYPGVPVRLATRERGDCPGRSHRLDLTLLERTGTEDMTSTKKDPVLVVLQLSGGNDAVNTLGALRRPQVLSTTGLRSAAPEESRCSS